MASALFNGSDYTSAVPGFNDVRSEAAERAFNYASQKNSDNMFGLVSGVPAARVNYVNAQTQADVAREQIAASKQNAWVTGGLGILGAAASGFTGGLGTAAGKKWFS